MKIITVHSKTHGTKEIFVDDEAFDIVSQHKWYIIKGRHTFYGVSGQGEKRKDLHRYLMDCVKGDCEIIDHVDGNGLNCQFVNLRRCTVQQNNRNSRGTVDSSSKYKGVHWHIRRQKWSASIRVNSKLKYLGLFTSEMEGALAYNAACREYFGDFAKLNIIE